MAKEAPFVRALRNFKNATERSMKYAKECAELAITHYAEHGDYSRLQQFMEAMPNNYVRRTAYVKWVVNYCPLSLDKGKFVTDQDRRGMEIDLKAALAEPFWDFDPETPVQTFSYADLFKALHGTIKRFENENRYKAKDVNTVEAISKIKSAIGGIENAVATKALSVNTDETPASKEAA